MFVKICNRCGIVFEVKKPSVVLIGDVCIDHNSIEGREYDSWGSGTLYMGVYSAGVLGTAPDVITSYGPDFAEFAPGEVRLLPRVPSAKRTMQNGNIVVEGHRTQYSHFSQDAVLPVIDSAIRASLKGADIVVATVLTPLFTPEYLESLLDLAPKDSVKILCPQGYFRDIQPDGSYKFRPFHEVGKLLPLFDLVSLSIEDYPNIIEAATEWTTETRETPVIITEAERGAVVVQNGQTMEIPTTPIALEDIVDPTGAGDVFAMSTALDFAESRDIVSAVRAGHVNTRSKLLGIEKSPLSPEGFLSSAQVFTS